MNTAGTLVDVDEQGVILENKTGEELLIWKQNIGGLVREFRKRLCEIAVADTDDSGHVIGLYFEEHLRTSEGTMTDVDIPKNSVSIEGCLSITVQRALEVTGLTVDQLLGKKGQRIIVKASGTGKVIGIEFPEDR